MDRILTIIVACVLPFLFAHCDNTFSASAPFQPRMVVYSVLTTESDTQYVRVYSSYNPLDNDPKKNQNEQSVADASVTISSDSALYDFQKIVVARTDTNRYASKIVAYVSYHFRPARGKTYRLTVSSPTLGTVTAATTLASAPSILPVNFFCLEDPFYKAGLNDYGVQVSLWTKSEALVVRIYVEYLLSTPQGWQLERRQIPIVMRQLSGWMGTWEMIYPVIKRRQSFNVGSKETQGFQTQGWKDLLKNVIWFSGEVRFLDVVFEVIQFDAPIYRNYSLANFYRDRYSVRLDEADYTNISGGVGVFGSLVVDSMVTALPEHIPQPPPK